MSVKDRIHPAAGIIIIPLGTNACRSVFLIRNNYAMCTETSSVLIVEINKTLINRHMQLFIPVFRIIEIPTAIMTSVLIYNQVNDIIHTNPAAIHDKRNVKAVFTPAISILRPFADQTQQKCISLTNRVYFRERLKPVYLFLNSLSLSRNKFNISQIVFLGFGQGGRRRYDIGQSITQQKICLRIVRV